MALLQRRPLVAFLSLVGCGVAAADTWEPPEALKKEGESLLVRWNALIQEGRFDEAYVDLAPAAKALVSVKQWADLQRAICNRSTWLIAR